MGCCCCFDHVLLCYRCELLLIFGLDGLLPPSRAVSHRYERWVSARQAASNIPLSVGCGLCCRAPLLETRSQGKQRSIITSTSQRTLEPWSKSSKLESKEVTHFELSRHCSFMTGMTIGSDWLIWPTNFSFSTSYFCPDTFITVNDYNTPSLAPLTAGVQVTPRDIYSKKLPRMQRSTCQSA